MPATDRPPSLPLYVNDFLGDVKVLALEQLGFPHGSVAAWGYTRLWMRSWEEPEPGVLPDDDEILASLSGIGIKRWSRYKPAIARCFDTTSRPGFWVQKRVVRERELMRQRRKIAAEYGRKGGRKAWKGRKLARDAQGTLKPGLTVGGIPSQGYPPAVASASASAVASAVRDVEPPTCPSGDGRVGVSPSASNGHDQPNPVAEWDEGFYADFWEAYPRKVKKHDARAAWRSLKPWTVEHLAAICDGLDRWIAYWKSQRTPIDKIPYPASFLRTRQHAEGPQ
jgi:uncharacterized protein YdaU (DUF1376 family)